MLKHWHMTTIWDDIELAVWNAGTVSYTHLDVYKRQVLRMQHRIALPRV